MATITGTFGNDELTGTIENDLITGRAGNDILNGGDGHDTLHGNEGDDDLYGGNGNDTLYGDEGDDYLDGGEFGYDTLYGGIGADYLVNGDALYGDDGNDSLSSNSRATGQILDGGSGDDSILLSHGQGQIGGGAGNDSLTVQSSNNILSGGLGTDTFRLSPLTFNTIGDLTAGPNGDIIDVAYLLAYGGATNYPGGNPFATGHLRLVQMGEDTHLQIDRYGGVNIVQFTYLVTLTNVIASSLTNFNLGGYAPDGSVSPGQTINGTTGNDNGTSNPALWGTVGYDSIHGLAGHDSLDGGDGADTLYGDEGNDYLNGGLGNDTLFGGLGADSLTDLSGTNALYGEDDNDNLSSYSWATGQLLDGGSGDDSLFLDNGRGHLHGGAGNDTINVQTSGNNLTGGSGTDTFQLSPYAFNTITDLTAGLNGDIIDVTYLLAYFGATNYLGGNPFATGYLRLIQSASDTLLQIDRNGASDGDSFRTLATLSNVTATSLISFNFGGYAPDGSASAGRVITGTTGNDNGSGNPILTGTAADDVIYGLAGNDRLDGADGADTLYGDEGDDSLEGWLGNDTLFGGLGADTLTEFYGTNALYGEEGDDDLSSMSAASGQILDGGSGNDRISLSAGQGQISGGTGDDSISVRTSNNILSGGTGTDTYYLSPNTFNTITDFTAGHYGDIIDIAYLIASGGFANYDPSNPFTSSNPFATGHLRLVQSSADTLLQIDRDGETNGVDFSTLATLANVTASSLTYYNFGGFTPTVVPPTPTATVVAPVSLVEGQTGALNVMLLNMSQWAGSITMTFSGAMSTATNGVDVEVSGFSSTYSISQSPSGSYMLALPSLSVFSDNILEEVETVSITIRATGQVFDTGTDTKTITIAIIDGGVRHGAQNDFNGDGRSDVLWRDASGAVTNWLGQANGAFVGNSANAFNQVDTSWQIAGTGDFNGDGRNDIAWRHSSGALAEWLGQATGGFVGNSNVSTHVDTSWRIAGTGDFNGDGRDDVLWRHTSGALTNWLGQADGSFVANNNAVNQVDNAWQVAATGDFNGDGRDDIVFRHTSGSFTEWLGQASGGYVSNHATANAQVGANWSIIGSGDFNGDGRDDILWRNATGTLTNWLGQGDGSFIGNAAVSASVGSSWHVVAIGDYNGDGRDDLAWRDNGGGFSEWLGRVDGGFTNNHAIASNQVGTSWQVQSPDLFFV